MALKILSATAPSTEMEIFRRLAFDASFAEGQRHVVGMRASFTLSGPNGTHDCLVLEALGPSMSSLLEQQSQQRSKHQSWLSEPRPVPVYPIPTTKAIIRQILMALAFIHHNGIVYANVQPGNILFAVNGLDSVQEHALGPACLSPVRRLDGRLDILAPRYLALSQPLTEFLDQRGPPFVKLCDMKSGKSSSCWTPSVEAPDWLRPPSAAFRQPGRPPKRFMLPALRAPEIILGTDPVEKGIDIFSVGCLMFECLTGVKLFDLSAWPAGGEEADDTHLLQMFDTLGPLPEELFARWTRRERYFGPGRRRLNSHPQASWSKPGTPVSSYVWPTLEARFWERLPDGMGNQDFDRAVSFVRLALQYDPAHRPSAPELQLHAWLTQADGEYSFDPSPSEAIAQQWGFRTVQNRPPAPSYRR